jgi:hypothetical protein
MTPTTPTPTNEPSLVSETPYRAVAGELVADAIALFELVRALRPEIALLTPGRTFHVAIDAMAGTIMVGLRDADGDVVLVERVLVDPREAATFGSSALPVVVQATTVQ